MLKGGVKRSVEMLLFSGSIPLGVLIFFFVAALLSINNKEDLYRNVSIVILLVIVLAVIGLLLFNTLSNKIESKKDRLLSLKGKKVYSYSGDFVGVLDEVFLGQNKIYGIKIKLDKSIKFKRKILVKSDNIVKYGEVVLVENKILKELGI